MDHFDFISLLDDDNEPRPARPQVARLVSREPAPGLDVSVALEESSGGFDNLSATRTW